MPSTSKAQSRLMHGVASGNIKGSGVPKKVARDFVAADAGKSQAELPQRVNQAAASSPPAKRAAAISQAAATPPGPSMSDVVAPRKGAY